MRSLGSFRVLEGLVPRDPSMSGQLGVYGNELGSDAAS
jgi:hypothetical protein